MSKITEPHVTTHLLATEFQIPLRQPTAPDALPRAFRLGPISCDPLVGQPAGPCPQSSAGEPGTHSAPTASTAPKAPGLEAPRCCRAQGPGRADGAGSRAEL